MTEIYRAGSQLTKVKAFMLVTLLATAGALYWGWDLFNTYGTAPGDGGVLAPVGQRLAWGLTVAGLGLALLAGMWIYGRQYAVRMGYDAASDTLHIYTLNLLAARLEVHPAADVIASTWHHGQMDTGDISVNAPWFFVKLKDRRWRLIVDGQGQFPEPTLARKLLKAG